MNSLSLIVQFFIKEFDQNRKIGERTTFPKGGNRYSILTTTHVSIYLKSGTHFNPTKGHYCVMRYPNFKEPFVKIAHFYQRTGEIYPFPDEIITIPLEYIESIKFGISGKIGIICYHKNKARI